MKLPFEFDPSNLSGTIITVPAGVTEKNALFSFYADAFSFPEYFGFNWDALEECLRDLENWHPEGQTFSIVHQDIPLISSPHDAGVYLAILQVALAEEPLIKHVVFPPKDSEVAQSLLLRFLKNEI